MVALSTWWCKAFRGVVLGAPASGKGTVSSRIVEHFKVAHISTGDKLRLQMQENTELGKTIAQYVDNGKFVPDNLMMSLLEKELKLVADKNWLLDGFPRTVEQADKLQELSPVNIVLNLDVPVEVILNRVKNRWIHLPSGRVYNIGFNSPKVPGKDDVTGEPLSKRDDDREEIVQKRLEKYFTSTTPVISYYEKLGLLHTFKGNTTAEIWPRVKETIEKFMS